MTKRSRSSTPPRWLVRTLGRVYTWGQSGRGRLFDWGILRSLSAPIPVVSVGNLVSGGAGKTPVVLWLARRLEAAGHKVAIVSRGYKGRQSGAATVVTREEEPTVPGPGDEPLMMARLGAASWVITARDRWSGAQLAAREGASLVLLDDGFQHRRLRRCLDILLIDAQRFGAPPSDPADFPRESPKALARAGLILLTRPFPEHLGLSRFLTPNELPPALARVLARLPRTTPPPVAAIGQQPGKLILPSGEAANPSWLRGRLILAVSGIARPNLFEDNLRQLGAIVAGHVAFPDHHPYSDQDRSTILRRMEECAAELIVTTAKDRVRWPSGLPLPAVLEQELIVPAAAPILALVQDHLQANPAAGDR